jgi:DNA-directed RNA polymerase specialized sigma24 family protein
MILDDQQIAALRAFAVQRARTLCQRNPRCGAVDADDIAQELFLRVWQRVERFNAAKGKWEAFCALIMSQGVCNLWRRYIEPASRRYDPVRAVRVHPHLFVRLVGDAELPSGPPTPLDEYDAEHDVAVFLDQLLADERQIALAVMESNYQAAGRAFGLSRRRLQALTKRFRTLLAELDLLDLNDAHDADAPEHTEHPEAKA